MPRPETFVDVLRARAGAAPERTAYAFLHDGDAEAARLTFGDLDRLARASAGRLLETVAPGDRAILLYPQGLDFIVALFACFYARVIPVPVSLPSRQRGLDTLRRIAEDSGAALLLAAGPPLRQLARSIEQDAVLARLRREDTERWTTDQADRDASLPRPDASDLALLQYTSGSTGTPRGVVVRHGSLVDNAGQVQEAFGHDGSTVILSWLPMFHDMGLGTVLQAPWLGVPCTLMAPAAFLQKPVRWLHAISRHRATTSGGPDFAYDLCARRITEEEIAGLELSSWRVAYNGAEPVRAATLQRFAGRFARAGFATRAFHPVYGLAEATLFVSSGVPGTGAHVATFDAGALQGGRATASSAEDASRLVSCGRTWGHTDLRIVEPESGHECSDGAIGEIWLRGPGVADGYWRRAVETERTFGARLAGGDGPWLRTGDLGFRSGGAVYVTGRLKDLIIVRGRNHYPQDVEATAAASHAALEPHGAAAFSVETDEGEKVVAALEVRRTALRDLDSRDVIRAVRAAVADAHGLQLSAVVLLKPGTLPRTSSGKVRRRPCARAFSAGELESITSWTFWPADGGDESGDPVEEAAAPPAGDRAEPLVRWLREYGGSRINSRVIDERRTIPPHVVLDFGNQGLLGMLAPETFGGLGLGHTAAARIIEQLAAIDLTLSLFVGLNNYLGIRPIARHGSPEMQRARLPALGAGRELAAFALTEPGAGSNPRALATRADPDGRGRWRLHGTKIWSGAAQWAASIIVFARHAGEHDGAITAFVVRQGTRGLRQGPEALTMGMRGLIQNTLHLDGVPVGAAEVLGDVGRGMDVAHDAMMHARLAVGAASLGAMKRCAQLALRYASRRDISTGSLLAHPVTLSRLGDMTCAIAALEAMVSRVAAAVDSGTHVPAEAFAACKSAGPELLWQTADATAQILGGRSYIEPNLVPQILRDARVLRIFEGPTETMHALLGARLLSDPDALVALAEQILGGGSAGAAVRSLAADAAPARAAAEAPLHGQALAGAAITELMLHAAAEGSLRGGTPREQRVVDWTRTRYEAAHAALTAVRDTGPSLTETRAAVEDYGPDIGEVDQQLAGEDHAVDPLLRAGWTPPAAFTEAPSPAAVAPGLREWLTGWLARRLKLRPEEIDASRTFADHGLDSLAAVELAQELSERIGRPLEDTILWNHPSIEALLAHVSRGAARPAAPAGQPAPAASLDEELAALERLLGSRDAGPGAAKEGP